jgi:hypothetical protein
MIAGSGRVRDLSGRIRRARGRLDFSPCPLDSVFHLFKPFIDLQTLFKFKSNLNFK